MPVIAQLVLSNVRLISNEYLNISVYVFVVICFNFLFWINRIIDPGLKTKDVVVLRMLFVVCLLLSFSLGFI